MINKPICIDIYHGNNVRDNPGPLGGLDTAKASGIFALIHKTSESTTLPDSRYDARRAKWMNNKPVFVTDVDGTKLSLMPLFGGYHFFHGQDPVAEAKFFVQTGRFGEGDLPFLDWEEVGKSGYQPSVAAADVFCQEVEQRLGRVCGVYGGNVPRERFAAKPAPDDVLERFQKRPLWFCAYGGLEKLRLLPEPWKAIGCFLWQDDGDRFGPGPHTIPGIDGYTDNSTVVSPQTFQGFWRSWRDLAGGKVVPTPKPAPAGSGAVPSPVPVETKPPVAEIEPVPAPAPTQTPPADPAPCPAPGGEENPVAALGERLLEEVHELGDKIENLIHPDHQQKGNDA